MSGGPRQVEFIRLPPHSVEAEQAVLGGLMLDATAWDRVSDVIEEAHFYRADHRLIWRTIGRLITASQPADCITVSEDLDARRELDNVGGLAYLGSLVQHTPTVANIRRWAEIVREKAVLRKVAEICMEGADLAYSAGGCSAAEVLEQVQQAIFTAGEASVQSAGLQQIDGAMKRAIEGMGKRGTPTGFTDIDEMTGGLNPGDLVVVAGRPSMGKTSVVMNMAESIAMGLKLPAAVFSLEMPDEALAGRLLTSHAPVNNFKFRKDVLNPEERQLLSASYSSLRGIPIYVDETGAITPAEVATRSRRLFRELGRLGVIIVDYLQLMSLDGLADSRADSVAVASRALKHLAKELQVPVIALSQLNRGVEQRPNKRPTMADLRDSGAIEQDADLIIFMYRDEVYNPDTPDKGIAEAIIAKQRNGPIGTAKLAWQGEFMRFRNFADPARH